MLLCQDASKVGAETRARLVVIAVIQRIEELGAELEIRNFLYWNVLEYGEIG